MHGKKSTPTRRAERKRNQMFGCLARYIYTRELLRNKHLLVLADNVNFPNNFPL